MTNLSNLKTYHVGAVSNKANDNFIDLLTHFKKYYKKSTMTLFVK